MIRRIAGKRTLLVLTITFFWLIPHKVFSQESSWPKFYIEPSYTFLDRGVDWDPYTVADLSGTNHRVQPKRSDAQANRLLMQIGAELTRNIELYALIGGSNLTILDRKDFDGLDFDSGLVPAYGGGARLRLYPPLLRPIGIVFFLDYHFLTYQEKENNVLYDPIAVTGNPVYPGPVVRANERITWREHVVKLGLSGRHVFFEPYGGFRFSYVDASDKLQLFPPASGQLNLNMSQTEVFGMFAGTYIYLDTRERIAFLIEGNVIDENSIKIGVRVNF